MSNLRRRIYSYLCIVVLLCATILSIRPIISNMDKKNQDFTAIPSGTSFPLRCNLITDKEYINCPNTMWIDNLTKIKTWLGINLDYWSIKTYECKLKVIKNPIREYVPSEESLITSGRFLTEINNGEINHYIFLSSPQEIECIICSVRTDHYTGFIGKICYIFEKNYQKNMTIKEFNRLLTCCVGMKYPNKISQ
ncbi:MAG: hypothetical protein EBU90_20290 [Proteobacteria bacterium]|nr:hypothetical protein [Pseudomonadota bacterium]NBP16033.1 hypothetical protein [bacterium]